jgi:hypothetical protein
VTPRRRGRRLWCVALGVVACLASVGCRKNSVPPTNPGGPDTCSVTISGPVAGTFDCVSTATAWASAGNTGVFSFFVAPGGTIPDVEAIIRWAGEPQAGHFVNTAPGAGGGAGVTLANTQAWSALAGGTSPQGSYDLFFTSVTLTQTIPTGKVFAAHGSLVAYLPAVAGSGASGTITMTATF